MNCPKCGREDKRGVVRRDDKVNAFGRFEITWEVETEAAMSWDQDRHIFVCRFCGFSLTAKEYTLGTLEQPVGFQSKLFDRGL